MFGLKRNMLKDIGTGDVVHFTDGTIATVDLVCGTSADGKYVELQFDTMISMYGPNRWRNVGWYNKSTGKQARYDLSAQTGELEAYMKHIVKVDRIARHLSYTTARELIEAKYGTIEPCECKCPLFIGGGSEFYRLSELKVGDTVQFRDGQVARVIDIEETENQKYPREITFNRFLTFKANGSAGKLRFFKENYYNNGYCCAFWKSNADIVVIIPSGLAERAAKVTKERERKKKEQEMKKTKIISLSKVKAGDSLKMRSGKIFRVKKIWKSMNKDYPYHITFEHGIEFRNGTKCSVAANYNAEGRDEFFDDRAVTIESVIPFCSDDRMNREAKQKVAKRKEQEMKNETVSLDKLKAGDRITFRDGQTVTASEVDYSGDGHYCITFNKKVRMKEPSGIKAVDFEIFRRDGTVTLKDWKSKDIVAIIPTERTKEKKEQSTDHVFTQSDMCKGNRTPVDLSKLRVGDVVYIRGGYRLTVERIERGRDAIYIEYNRHVKPENVKFATNNEWYSYDGKCIGRAAKKELDIISISKVETKDKPFASSAELAELAKAVAELTKVVAELKKQITALTSLKGNVKDPKITDDGNMLFASKTKAKKKGTSNAI